MALLSMHRPYDPVVQSCGGDLRTGELRQDHVGLELHR